MFRSGALVHLGWIALADASSTRSNVWVRGDFNLFRYAILVSQPALRTLMKKDAMLLLPYFRTVPKKPPCEKSMLESR